MAPAIQFGYDRSMKDLLEMKKKIEQKQMESFAGLNAIRRMV